MHENQSGLNISKMVDSTSQELAAARVIGKISFGKHIEATALALQTRTDGWLGSNFVTSWSVYGERDGKHPEIPESRKMDFLKSCAPEAAEIFQLMKGENWFKELDSAEIARFKDIAEHGYRKNILGSLIAKDLGVEKRTKVTIPQDSATRLGLVHKAMSYDAERRNVEDRLHLLTQFIGEKGIEGETVQIRTYKTNEMVRRAEQIIERSHSRRTAARELFELPGELKQSEQDLARNAELNKVFPSLIDSASMISEKSNRSLMARLGVTRDDRGDYVVTMDQKPNDGKHAMRMVLDQRIRNNQIKEVNNNVEEVIKSGRLKEDILQDGADLLVLRAIETDSATDCGRFFQEEVRRTILREKMHELVSIGEHNPPTYQDISDREVMIGAGRALQEMYFMAEGVLRTMARMVDSAFTINFKPGGFMHRITGSLSGKMRGIADNFLDSNLSVPKIVLPGRDPSRWSEKLAMPDFFAEYDQ